MNAYICKHNVSYHSPFVLKHQPATVDRFQVTLVRSLLWFAGFSVHGCTLHTDQGQSRFSVNPAGGAVVCELFLPVSLEDRFSRSIVLKPTADLRSGLRIQVQPCHLCDFEAPNAHAHAHAHTEALQQLHMKWACWGGGGGRSGVGLLGLRTPLLVLKYSIRSEPRQAGSNIVTG